MPVTNVRYVLTKGSLKLYLNRAHNFQFVWIFMQGHFSGVTAEF